VVATVFAKCAKWIEPVQFADIKLKVYVRPNPSGKSARCRARRSSINARLSLGSVRLTKKQSRMVYRLRSKHPAERFPSWSDFACESITLSGFKSRWIMRFSCAASSASAICFAIRSASPTQLRNQFVRSNALLSNKTHHKAIDRKKSFPYSPQLMRQPLSWST